MNNTEFRYKMRFLLWPKTINGKTRCFEMAKWEEERHKIQSFNWFNVIGGPIQTWSEWKPTKWIWLR